MEVLEMRGRDVVVELWMKKRRGSRFSGDLELYTSLARF